jgi:hypothetical protein
MAWIAYAHQLWPGLRYGLGTMTNDIEEATGVNTKTNYRMLNILGVARRFMRSRMDYILHQNRATVDRHILGEVTIDEFISCGNAWSMCLTPTCQSAFRVL